MAQRISETQIEQLAAKRAVETAAYRRLQHDNAEHEKSLRDSKRLYVAQPYAGPTAADLMAEELVRARADLERQAFEEAAIAAAPKALVEELRDAEFCHACAQNIGLTTDWKSATAKSAARLAAAREAIFGAAAVAEAA